MVQKGRKRIAILGGLEGSWTAKARSDGYISGLKAHGLQPFRILKGDYSYDAGRAAADELMTSGKTPPDAVLCANDLSAFGLMDGLREDKALTIPGDMSVIGYDDVPMAAWASYQLTSVRLPIRRMVDQLIELLQRSVSLDEPPTEVRFVP